MNNQTRSNPCWRLGLVSVLVIGGAIASSGEYAWAQMSLNEAASQLTICDLITNSQDSSCGSSNPDSSGNQRADVSPQPGNPNGHDPGAKLGNTQFLAPDATQQLPAGARQEFRIPGGLQQQFNLPATGK